MKRHVIHCGIILTLLFGSSLVQGQEKNVRPDSLYLFSYFTNKEANRHGMHYAWRAD